MDEYQVFCIDLANHRSLHSIYMSDNLFINFRCFVNASPVYLLAVTGLYKLHSFFIQIFLTDVRLWRQNTRFTAQYQRSGRDTSLHFIAVDLRIYDSMYSCTNYGPRDHIADQSSTSFMPSIAWRFKENI